MEYDRDYVTKWREKAITNLEDLSVGETYYSNQYGPILLMRFITNRQYDDENGIRPELRCSDPNEIRWIEIKVHDWEEDRSHHSRPYAYSTVVSLQDNNVGNHYNPWLIFKDYATMKEYKDGLKITYSKLDEYDNLADDWFV